MAELDDKLGAILNNPQLMQQIMNLAQSLNASGNTPTESTDTKTRNVKPESPPLNLAALSRLGNLSQKINIDSEQQNLLRALSPYLSRGKLAKLERAMHAAKMASLASAFLNSGGLQLLAGR